MQIKGLLVNWFIWMSLFKNLCSPFLSIHCFVQTVCISCFIRFFLEWNVHPSSIYLQISLSNPSHDIIVGYNMPRFWEVTWSTTYSSVLGKNTTEVIPTQLRLDQYYIEVLWESSSEGSCQGIILFCGQIAKSAEVVAPCPCPCSLCSLLNFWAERSSSL